MNDIPCSEIFEEYSDSRLMNMINFLGIKVEEPSRLEMIIELIVYMKKMNEIDIFDFERFKDELKLFKKYFKDSELVFRLANYISYKYNWIKIEPLRKKIEQKIKESKNPKKELEIITDTINLEEILMSFYKHYNKDKADEDYIEYILNKYNTCENVLLNKLYNKYNLGKEIDIYNKLWVADCKRPKPKAK